MSSQGRIEDRCLVGIDHQIPMFPRCDAGTALDNGITSYSEFLNNPDSAFENGKFELLQMGIGRTYRHQGRDRTSRIPW
jgi:hypothetical protein